MSAGLCPISDVTAAQRHPIAVLATTILASSLAFVDGSVVNVALACGERLSAAVERTLVAGRRRGRSLRVPP
jgi:hypothetical protein